MQKCCAVPLYTTDPVHFQLQSSYESASTEKYRLLPPQVSYNKAIQRKEEKYYGLMKIKILRKFTEHKLYFLNGQLC